MAKKKPKLGSGKRFKTLKNKLARNSKANKRVRDPEALAASIGMMKYGKKKMAQMAATGRKRASKKRARKK